MTQFVHAAVNRSPTPIAGVARPMHARTGSLLQRRLRQGRADDPLEHEADRVADEVMRSSSPRVASNVSTGLQGWRAPSSAPGVAAPDSVEQVLSELGTPLVEPLRQDMERRFARDFSAVRVHTNLSAEKSAFDVGAKAYTVGGHIVFAGDHFDPLSPGGRRLIAHELTHVVQQGKAPPLTSDGSAKDPDQTHSSGLTSHHGPMLQRQAADAAARLNAALSVGNWADAARSLAELPEADALSALRQLNPAARQQLRDAARRLDPSPDNPVTRWIEQVGVAAPGGDVASAAPVGAAPAADIGSMSAAEKLGRAYGFANFREEALRQLGDLFAPRSLAIMAGFVVAYVAAQLTPVGWVADAIALASLSVAAIFMGRLLFQIVEDHYRYFSAVNSTTDAELRAAGEALARAVASGGIQIVILLLTRSLRGGRGGSGPRTPPPEMGAEAVTSAGVVVRVPPAAIPSLPAPSLTLARTGAGAPGLRGFVPEPASPALRPARPATPARPTAPVEPVRTTPQTPARPATPPARVAPAEVPQPRPPSRPTGPPDSRPWLGEGRLRDSAPLVVATPPTVGPAAPSTSPAPQTAPVTTPATPGPQTSPQTNPPMQVILVLPGQKAIHAGLYQSLVAQRSLEHVPGLPRHTAQASNWDRDLRPGGAMGMSQITWQRFDALDIAESRRLRPNWTRTAPEQNRMEVDHRVEWQLLGTANRQWGDTMVNYELLDRDANGTSGSQLRANIAAERTRLVSLYGPQWATARIVFTTLVVQPPVPADRWLPEEVEMGEHYNALRLHLRQRGG